jgi:lactoylglutathione lyase
MIGYRGTGNRVGAVGAARSPPGPTRCAARLLEPRVQLWSSCLLQSGHLDRAGPVGGSETSSRAFALDPSGALGIDEKPPSCDGEGLSNIGLMRVDGFESLILFVSDLAKARAFYVDALGLPVVFEDEIIVVVGGPTGRVVLHRNDRGHDERGIFPPGAAVGGAAVRFAVDDPDACERAAAERGVTVVWPTQDATWGRFVVLADPDGRSVVLARMKAAAA